MEIGHDELCARITEIRRELREDPGCSLFSELADTALETAERSDLLPLTDESGIEFVAEIGRHDSDRSRLPRLKLDAA